MALTIVVFGFVFKDWRQDVQDVVRAERVRHHREMPQRAEGLTTTGMDEGGKGTAAECASAGAIVRVLLSNWVEVVLIGFMALILVSGITLKYATLCLWVVLILREFFQLTVSVRR